LSCINKVYQGRFLPKKCGHCGANKQNSAPKISVDTILQTEPINYLNGVAIMMCTLWCAHCGEQVMMWVFYGAGF